MDPNQGFSRKMLTSLMRDLESLTKDADVRPTSAAYDSPLLCSMTTQHAEAFLTPQRPRPFIVVVTSKSEEAFPRLPDEVGRALRLGDAIMHIYQNFVVGPDPMAISIIVDEGVYVDNVPDVSLPENVSLEIIGVKSVLLVTLLSGQILFGWKANVSFRNVAFCDESHLFDIDLNEASVLPNLFVRGGAQVSMTDVRIRTPVRRCLHVRGRQSRLNLLRCSLTKSLAGFEADQGGSITLNQCYLTELSKLCGFIDDSSLAAKETKFTMCQVLQLFSKSRASLRDCYFKGVGSKMSAGVGLIVETESSAFLQNATFEHLRAAIKVDKSSKVQLRQSHIDNCETVFHTLSTVHIAAFDNRFSCTNLLVMEGTGCGSIELKRNRMVEGSVPLFARNGPSVKIDHDFEKVLLGEWNEARKVFEVVRGYRDFDHVGTSGEVIRSNKIKNKERAAYTKKKRDALRSDGKSHPDIFDIIYKYCGRCKRQEEIVGECGFVQEPSVQQQQSSSEREAEKKVPSRKKAGKKKSTESQREECGGEARGKDDVEGGVGVADADGITKFKYCSKCDTCYCSKKCQADDWEDHKWICGMHSISAL